MGDGARFNHFNASEYLASQEAPTLVFGSLVYRGRLLSLPEWLRVSTQLEQLSARQTAGETIPQHEYQRVYRAYLRMVFPRNRFRFWAPDPVAQLFQLPWGAVTEAIRSFFALQALASTPRKSPSEMHATTSAPPTTSDEPSTTTAPS